MKAHHSQAPLALLMLIALLALPVSAQRRRAAAPRASAPTPSAPAASSSRQENIERPLDTSVSADSYAVYVEARGLGQLARMNEIKAALAAFRLVGGETQEVTDLIDFVTANEEALATVRVVSAALPARPDIPQALLALQFPGPDSARLFEPKLRAFINQQARVKTPAPPKGKAAGRAQAKPPASALSFAVKRAGSWLYASDEPFTFKNLKGDGAHFIANNARLQSFRARLASDSVFVYFDVALSRRGFNLQMEKARKQAEVAQANTPVLTAEAPVGASTGVIVGPVVMPSVVAEVETTPVETRTPEVEPTPEASQISGPEVDATAETEAEANRAAVAETDRKAAGGAVSMKSKEERAARAMMSTLLSGIFSGGLREPEAVGVGVGLDGDFIAARALVAKDAGAPISIIPFLPNVVSGPAIVPDSFSVAPADSEVFATGSLDWTRIYDTLVANLDKPQPSALRLGDGGAEEPARGSGEDKVQPASSQKTIEAMEKLFGFRVREDLLPALGNEVSVSLPLDFFEGRRRRSIDDELKQGTLGGEKPARPGPVVLIALNNPEALRKVMPLALAAFGLGGGGQAQTERRKGFDIQDIGGMAYVFINNYLVVGENAPAVRHVVDAYTSNQTLAMSAKFRDSIAWQEHQRLALAYISDGLMKTWVESAKKTASGSADPVVLAALAQLDVPPSSVSYAVTNESDALLHSLRLPIPLIKVFAASSIIAVKEAPVTGNESMATYAMMRVASAEEAYKTGKGRNRYGSLEELYAEKVLEKDYALPGEYEFKLEVVGDKFTLSATPKNYGKTGRRSFFVDETGTVRAADHKGEPATADDPPVDQ